MTVNIDMTTASFAENTRYRGFGLISANNSSRLLLDYKYEQPERYDEILNYLFGKDGGAQMAANLDIPFLGQIPLVQDIREGADDGTPAALLDRPDSQAFQALAQKLLSAL